MVVAIDGPAGSGKSSISKRLAKELGFLHLDTGAIYRALTLYYLEKSIDISSEDEVKKHLADIEIDFKIFENEIKVYLNNRDVSKEIRSKEVTNAVSLLSSYGSVRNGLIPIQRSFADKYSLIVDGRDIGSTIFPDAEIKVFLDADIEERAKRRYIEIYGNEIDEEVFDKIKKEIEIRDKKDSGRAITPTKIAEDAILIDSSLLSEDEVFELISKMIKKIGA